MLRTRITEEYRLDTPIIGAGTAFVATPKLAAAVSNAGGMGMLGGSPLAPEALRGWIRETRALTARPFGVHFLTPFTECEHIEVCRKERVAVVSFSGEAPPEAFIMRLRAGGARVWMQVGSVEMAREAVEARVDALIVQGREAGGNNRSTTGTLVLVPAVVDAVAPVPVVAAGGIADGRGMVAALALGAEAVWIGTRLLASEEADTLVTHKERLLALRVGESRLPSFSGSEWIQAQLRALQESDEVKDIPLAAGESAGLIDRILPAVQIIQEMTQQAENILCTRMAPMLGAMTPMIEE